MPYEVDEELGMTEVKTALKDCAACGRPFRQRVGPGGPRKFCYACRPPRQRYWPEARPRILVTCPECGVGRWLAQRSEQRCFTCGRRAAGETMSRNGTGGGNGRQWEPDEGQREKAAAAARDRHLDTWGRERAWTPGRIISAIRHWAALYGEPPRALDWRTGAGGRARRTRHRYPPKGTWGKLKVKTWPTEATVKRVCGSWNAAIQAAGFEPRPRGYDPASEETRRKKQTCPRGHPFDEANTASQRSGRRCKRCRRERQRKERAAKRAAA